MGRIVIIIINAIIVITYYDDCNALHVLGPKYANHYNRYNRHILTSQKKIVKILDFRELCVILSM